MKSTDLFEGLSDILLKEGLISEKKYFQKHRMDAEIKARRSSIHEEISFDEIYELLSTHYNWSSNQSCIAKKIEIDFELKNLRPNKEIVNEVNRLIDAGEKVCFASDMYLPDSVITKALLQNGIRNGFDLFVSSSSLKTKHHASLYSIISKHYDVSYNDISHKGDNKFSDYTVPKKLGIRANWYMSSIPSRYERTIYDLDIPHKKLLSLLAGCMKSARLSRSFSEGHKKTIWETGTNVIGPILLFYVIWVLQTAKAKGINRLYFVSRDGQILLEIAKVIQKYCGYFQSVECCYLYGSRQAWHLPSITSISDSELDWIFDNTHFLSVESICKRVELAADSIEDILSGHGLPKHTWNKNLSESQRGTLSNLFRSSVEIQEKIVKKAAEKRSLLLSYLDQEHFFESDQVGIVDIGWRGRLQSSLNKSIQSLGYSNNIAINLNGFYWGLFQDAAQNKLNGNFFSFFKKPFEKRKTDSLANYGAILEIFVGATHGSCIGYAHDGYVYKPLLKEQVNLKMFEWGIELQQQAILQFCIDFCSSISSEDFVKIDYESQLHINAVLLTMFYKHPTRKEADSYGMIKMYEDQTENISYELAPKASFSDPIIKHNHNIWKEGIRARNRLHVYGLYRSISIIQKIKKRILTLRK